MSEQAEQPIALPVASPAPLAARTKQVRVTGAFAADYVDVVLSPCVSLCKRNADRSHCIGCYRSIDEIRAWSKAETAERQQIWLQALGRAGLGSNGRPLVPAP